MMTMTNSEFFNSISEQTVDRYTQRLRKLGEDVKTLGWGSTDQQLYRFHNFTNSIDLTNKSILDIGCGFGDLFGHLQRERVPFSRYTGWDINSEFVAIATRKFSGSQVGFSCFDILNNTIGSIQADVGVMLGLLNYKYNQPEANLSMTKQVISNAFSSVGHCLYVDFLSSFTHPSYPKEDLVFYHSPVIMLEIALSISSNVRLLHDYAPIPQKEFALVIYK